MDDGERRRGMCRRSGVPEQEMVEGRSRCLDGSVVRSKRVLTIEVSGGQLFVLFGVV